MEILLVVFFGLVYLVSFALSQRVLQSLTLVRMHRPKNDG